MAFGAFRKGSEANRWGEPFGSEIDDLWYKNYSVVSNIKKARISVQMLRVDKALFSFGKFLKSTVKFV